MAGVDIGTVQELTGRKGISMTLRYSHLTPKHRLAAVERLDNALNACSGERAAIPPEGRTDTTTDTRGFSARERTSAEVAVIHSIG